MNLNSILFILLICLLQSSLNAMSTAPTQRLIKQDFSDFSIADTQIASSGFIIGYTTGLVPVAGQVALPFLVCTAKNSRITPDTFDIFSQSVALGHAAGVATIISIYCYAAKKIRRPQISENQIETGFKSFSKLHLN